VVVSLEAKELVDERSFQLRKAIGESGAGSQSSEAMGSSYWSVLWIAYTSNDGGQPNVYAQPFPGPAGNTKSRVAPLTVVLNWPAAIQK